MRQSVGWLVALTIGAMIALLMASVLVFPRLLHPPLSESALQGVADDDKRVELQQAQARLQNDARATLLQGIAGLLLVAGVIATWRQVQVSREGQITERFARAIDHLGSEKPDVRLGGIYTLERIANDSPPDRSTVEAVLAAFVRTHAPWLVGAPEGPEHPTATVDDRLPPLDHRAVDVSTAMVVLGRRPPSRHPQSLYLSRVDLRVAYLPDARLSKIWLRQSNLARARMPGIDLSGSLMEYVDLREANLQQASLNSAKLYGAYLQGAKLQEAKLQKADLREADLRGANLQGAQLEGANLSGASSDHTTVWPDGFRPN